MKRNRLLKRMKKVRYNNKNKIQIHNSFKKLINKYQYGKNNNKNKPNKIIKMKKYQTV